MAVAGFFSRVVAVGFIGRTKETTDGRFQRDASGTFSHPGCHFRALMS